MSKRISLVMTTGLLATFPLDRLNEELVARGFTPQTDAATAATVIASGCRSLDDVTCSLVNLTHGEVTGKTVTEALRHCFPQHSVEERHGPHYLSLLRTGESSTGLALRYEIASGRKAKAKAAVETVTVTVEVEKTYDLSALDPKRLERLRKAAEGTPLEQLIERCLSVPAPTPAAAPEAEQAAAAK